MRWEKEVAGLQQIYPFLFIMEIIEVASTGLELNSKYEYTTFIHRWKECFETLKA